MQIGRNVPVYQIDILKLIGVVVFIVHEVMGVSFAFVVRIFYTCPRGSRYTATNKISILVRRQHTSRAILTSHLEEILA
jgi:hypothetical protein